MRGVFCCFADVAQLLPGCRGDARDGSIGVALRADRGFSSPAQDRELGQSNVKKEQVRISGVIRNWDGFLGGRETCAAGVYRK